MQLPGTKVGTVPIPALGYNGPYSNPHCPRAAKTGSPVLLSMRVQEKVGLGTGQPRVVAATLLLLSAMV